MKLTAIAVPAIILAAACQLRASTIITETFSWTGAAIIPDGDLSGLALMINPNTQVGVLTEVSISLETEGGWNGDLYAYIWHAGEITVLLNRTGRNSTNPAGSGASGFSLILEDSATTDIHGISGSTGIKVAGTYQPDGRNVHPLSVMDNDTRSTNLGTFTGDNAAGEWRLFVADVAPGGTASVTGWTVKLTGEVVPEPATASLGAFAALLFLRRRRAATV
jgi:hypothetical protein